MLTLRTMIACGAAALAIVLAGCGRAPVRPAAANGVGVVETADRGSVVATVELPDYGTDVVAADGRVYVTTPRGKVIVVDPSAARVAAEVVVDGEPYALAVTPNGRRVYVADLHGRGVSVIDTANGRVTTRIPVGTLRRPSQPPSVAASDDGSRVYVGDTAHDHLIAIATDTDRVVKDLFLGFHPSDVAVGGDGRLVYVVGCRLRCTDGTLLAIDTGTWATVSRLALTSVPTAFAVTRDGRRAYIANGRDATVTAVDLSTQSMTTIAVGPQPGGIALDPGGRFAYVTGFAAGRLSVIATATNAVVATYPITSAARAIAVSSDGRFAYVTHSTSILSIVELAGIRDR